MAYIDFYIYNNDFAFFNGSFIVRKRLHTLCDPPHFLDGGENAAEIINTIPKKS